MIRRLFAIIIAIIALMGGHATHTQAAPPVPWIITSISCNNFSGGTITGFTLFGGPSGATVDITTDYYQNAIITGSPTYSAVIGASSIPVSFAPVTGLVVKDNNNSGASFSCFNVGSASAFSGPAIPRNQDGTTYGQKLITCNTTVFDAPGGNAIKGASVKEGQVFYAGKDTEEDADGKSWTPIFVSSVPVVWIWSSCVK